MAFLFVDSLAQNNSRFVQVSGKILELLLLSVGLISTILVLKEAVLPYSCEIVFSSLMGFWSSIRCFLSSPLTIIITINVMVVLIFASSASYRCREADNQHQEITILDVDDLDIQIAHHESPIAPPPSAPPWDVVEVTPPQPPPPPPPPSAPPIWDVVDVTPPPPFNVAKVETPPSRTTIPIRNNTIPTPLHQGTRYHDVSSTPEFVEKATLPSPKASFFNHALVPQPHQIDKTEEKTVTTVVTAPPPPLEKWKDVFIENEDTATNGPSYDQESEEQDNTMEATWEAIIGGGKPKPKKKHLKKSKTRDAPPRRLDSEEVLPTSPKWKELRKAETFNDAVSAMRRGGLIRRDPSMSLEEFNQKVERFINGIRLQRQESHRRFLDILNRKRL